jgi:hypothetical protein
MGQGIVSRPMATGPAARMTRRATAAAKPVAAPIAADELDELARLVGTLRPDWKGDVWRFYERRSDLAARLRKLARWAREQQEAGGVEGRSV